MKQGAQLFASLKQFLKLCTRQRDKAMMLSVIEEVSRLSPTKYKSDGYSLLRSNSSGICSPFSTNL